jgi:hypothetical protein
MHEEAGEVHAWIALWSSTVMLSDKATTTYDNRLATDDLDYSDSDRAPAAILICHDYFTTRLNWKLVRDES